MNKKQVRKKFAGDDAYDLVSSRLVNELRDRCKRQYLSQYYSLFMNSIKWEGLTNLESEYVMRRLWKDGTVAIFPIKHTDRFGFCPWSQVKVNMYGEPKEVQLIDTYSSGIVPTNIQVVDKDVCLCYVKHNHEPIVNAVEWYIDRIVQIDMIINNNLCSQSMPFLVSANENNKSKLTAIMNKILNNELVIFANMSDLQQLKVDATNAPYIVDKLAEYRADIQNELFTFLGIDNNGLCEKKEKLLVDEVNSNNEIINLYNKDIRDSIQEFCDDVKEFLGFEISAETTNVEVEVKDPMTASEQPTEGQEMKKED